MENRWDTGKCCLNWFGSKGSNQLSKIVFSFGKVKHCKGGRGGGVRRSAAQKQQQAQAAAKTAAATSRNRNTSNKKSSNKQQNQEQHKQHKQQPRKSEGQEVWVPKVGEGASSRGISVVFEAFFLETSKICNNWSLTFSEVFGDGNSIVKLFLTFCKKPPGWTRQPVSPNVHSWHRRFKHHQNSTMRPPGERKRAKMGGGRGKKGRHFGRSGGVGFRGEAPDCWAPKGGAPKGGRPTISRLFFPLPPLFSFFLPLLGVVSWNFVV